MSGSEPGRESGQAFVGGESLSRRATITYIHAPRRSVGEIQRPLGAMEALALRRRPPGPGTITANSAISCPDSGGPLQNCREFERRA